MEDGDLFEHVAAPFNGKNTGRCEVEWLATYCLDYKKYVRIDKRFLRPIEVHALRGDYSKARRKLGWKPKTSFRQLVRLMVDADIAALERDLLF